MRVCARFCFGVFFKLSSAKSFMRAKVSPCALALIELLGTVYFSVFFEHSIYAKFQFSLKQHHCSESAVLEVFNDLLLNADLWNCAALVLLEHCINNEGNVLNCLF